MSSKGNEQRWRISPLRLMLIMIITTSAIFQWKHSFKDFLTTKPSTDIITIPSRADFNDDEDFVKLFPPQAQMGHDQVRAILKALPRNGNMLVWGLGNDSPYWHAATTGKVIFLEDHDNWFRIMQRRYPALNAFLVSYKTQTIWSWFRYSNRPKKWSNLYMHELPEEVLSTLWDVFIVDAPVGCRGAGPGRYQSIYMSHELVQKRLKDDSTVQQIHIFVDDFHRKVERDFSQQVFDKKPVEVIERNKPANKQAHFVFTK